MLDFNTQMYSIGFSTVPDSTIIGNEERFGAHHYERIEMVDDGAVRHR